jgi:hypothetical protein
MLGRSYYPSPPYIPRAFLVPGKVRWAKALTKSGLCCESRKATIGGPARYSVSIKRIGSLGSPSSVMLRANSITLKVDEQGMFGAFEGTLNPGGASITGTWLQGGFGQPIKFDRATKKTEWKDPSSHSVRFAAVDHGVRLEILDWGGSGPPLVLLAGLGNTAHVFDRFAPKLTASNHVYGITPRIRRLQCSPVGVFGGPAGR